MINIDDKTRNGLESVVTAALATLTAISGANNIPWLAGLLAVLTGLWNFYTSHKAGAKVPVIQPAEKENEHEKVSS